MKRWDVQDSLNIALKPSFWVEQAKPAYYIDAPTTTKIHFNRGHANFIDAPTTKTLFNPIATAA